MEREEGSRVGAGPGFAEAYGSPAVAVSQHGCAGGRGDKEGHARLLQDQMN